MRAPFIDHVTFNVRDLEASRAFYEAALAPFGVRVVAYGEKGSASAPRAARISGLNEGEPRAPVHIAFLAHDPATVDAFHAAALEAGGTDNGAPGRRPDYHERYYAAYVLDPDGNNVEAVCHTGPSDAEASWSRGRSAARTSTALGGERWRALSGASSADCSRVKAHQYARRVAAPPHLTPLPSRR